MAGIRSGTIPVVHHRRMALDGLEIFYREAGKGNARTLLLLHGFPTSSHMFRRLLPALAEEFHVVAPDLPGFGLSSSPDRSGFPYTFGMFAETMEAFLCRLGIARYGIYVMDYGAPTGFRMMLRDPDRVACIVTQNGNAYEEGLSTFWAPLREFWADNSAARRDALRHLVTPAMTRFQYVDGVPDPSRLDPAAWLHDQIFLDRPGNVEIQLDLLYDYRENVRLYPEFQTCFRSRQPPTLVVWGQNDQIFLPAGARAFQRDLPDAELHLLDTGHFALEDKLDEIAQLIGDFLSRRFVP